MSTSRRSEYDAAGRRRSAATFPEFHRGRAPGNKGQTYDATVFQPTEVLKLLRSIQGGGPIPARNRALFAFLWRTGVRVVELLNVRESELDETTGFVRIRRTEARKARDVYMFGSRDAPDWGWQQLRPWLERRSALGIVSSAPLFCVCEGRTKGQPIRAAQVRSVLQRYSKEAGLHGRFPLNGFRNTLAVELHENELSVGQIQQQLGHSALSVTQDLLERLGAVRPLDDLHNYRPNWRSDDA